MGKKLYVGNLPYQVGDAELEQLFSEFGSVQSVQVIHDRDTGRSKGFGFVEMGSDQEAQAAIQSLHDQEVNGRRLTVNEAKPREPRSGGGGYGGGGGAVTAVAVAVTAVGAVAVVAVVVAMVAVAADALIDPQSGSQKVQERVACDSRRRLSCKDGRRLSRMRFPSFGGPPIDPPERIIPSSRRPDPD